MAKLSIGQKAERLLKLLIGLRNARVAEALRQYGFKESDLAEGWRLLQALTKGRLLVRGPVKKDPALLKQLDKWENHWFPIAVATLRGRFPEVYDWLFLNLSQTEGDGVVISVSTLLSRLEQMPTEPSLGARGAEAREVLTERGFTPSTLQIAEHLLAALGSTATAPALPTSPVDAAAQEAAEKAMWTWYLEWGEIARVAITDRKLLRELGFLNYKRPVTEEVEVEEPPTVAVGSD
jgi:hypothetical protein